MDIMVYGMCAANYADIMAAYGAAGGINAHTWWTTLKFSMALLLKDFLGILIWAFALPTRLQSAQINVTWTREWVARYTPE